MQANILLWRPLRRIANPPSRTHHQAQQQKRRFLAHTAIQMHPPLPWISDTKKPDQLERRNLDDPNGAKSNQPVPTGTNIHIFTDNLGEGQAVINKNCATGWNERSNGYHTGSSRIPRQYRTRNRFDSLPPSCYHPDPRNAARKCKLAHNLAPPVTVGRITFLRGGG